MRKLALILAGSCYLFSFQLLAKIEIHFTKVQFYLNDQERTDSFKIRNEGNDDAMCSINLTHFRVNEDSSLSRVDEGLDGVYNPANKLVRYSPRRVNILKYTSQVVRLSFRRIPKLEDGEYSSYLRIQCNESKYGITADNGNANARFSYNLPVFIRHGEVNSASQLASAKLIATDELSYVEVKHERLPETTGSVIGDYEVIGKDSGDIYGVLKGDKVYAPAKFKNIQLVLSKEPSEPVQVKFTMNSKLGDVVLVQDVTN